MWTKFWDMHSGGGCKEPPYEKIYIEAPESEAMVIFYNKFGHSPSRVTCTCCGEDYSVSEFATLEDATRFQREQEFSSRPKISLEDYEKQPDVLVIRESQISDDLRVGELPQQGYVWVD